MLETEVDDDFFTPSSNTTLANIFDIPSKSKDTPGNCSLKYTAPKPQKETSNTEENKATECIFACAFQTYVWVNGTYTDKGKLGFALLKILKSGMYNVILYDSSKATQSCTTITPKMELIVKEKYMSFFDNTGKYWSVYGPATDIEKVVEILVSLNVTIKTNEDMNEQPYEPNNVIETYPEVNKESDTDSSVNRKTKSSIMNKMASMGHSVLPAHPKPIPITTSNSSDSDSNVYSQTLKHKPNKSIARRNNMEKKVTDIETIPRSDINTLSNNNYDRQIAHVPIHSLVTSTSDTNASDIRLFTTEQRMNNSEIRINLNRIGDKVNDILINLKDIQHKDSMTTQNEILQKLIKEYESKIHFYEGYLKSKGEDIQKIMYGQLVSHSGVPKTNDGDDNQSEHLRITIVNLEKDISEKDEAIAKLKEEVQNLEYEISSKRQETLTCEALQKQIEDLTVKNNELLLRSKDNQIIDNNDTENKIKSIMNETFQAISANLDATENYSGEFVKKIIAKIIKNVTMQSFNVDS